MLWGVFYIYIFFLSNQSVRLGAGTEFKYQGFHYLQHRKKKEGRGTLEIEGNKSQSLEQYMWRCAYFCNHVMPSVLDKIFFCNRNIFGKQIAESLGLRSCCASHWLVVHLSGLGLVRRVCTALPVKDPQETGLPLCQVDAHAGWKVPPRRQAWNLGRGREGTRGQGQLFAQGRAEPRAGLGAKIPCSGSPAASVGPRCARAAALGFPSRRQSRASPADPRSSGDTNPRVPPLPLRPLRAPAGTLAQTSLPFPEPGLGWQHAVRRALALPRCCDWAKEMKHRVLPPAQPLRVGGVSWGQRGPGDPLPSAAPQGLGAVSLAAASTCCTAIARAPSAPRRWQCWALSRGSSLPVQLVGCGFGDYLDL